MAQVRKRDVLDGRNLDEGQLLKLAGKRTKLPKISMRVKYEDDVDLLSIRFGSEVDPTVVDLDDGQGVIGIYKGRKLIGIEILDITNRLRYVNPH